jgi:CubicO group peptidase (beta-lactamase class C family)
VFSSGKALTATCLLMLVDRGAVGLDEPVATYWPEFAAAGKEGVTVRMLLSHRAGLPAISQLLPQGAAYDWDEMTFALAEQAPWWEPGSAHGYHVNTFGYLVGEVVRRVTGEGIERFLEREIAQPLGADVSFGMPADDARPVAEYIYGPDVALPGRAGLEELKAQLGEQTVQMISRAYWNPPGVNGVGTVNTPEWRAAVIPSTNAHGTARGLARFYAALTDPAEPLMSGATLNGAIAEASFGPDRVLGRETRFGLGFQLTQPDRLLGPNPRAFGHFGVGGSLGFADPDIGLAFAYTMNLGGQRWQSPRNRALLDALYESLVE